MSTALDLARTLIQQESVTPDDNGCQDLIAGRLHDLGFTCEALPFGEVSNLWAVHGDTGPLFCFAGHTDVVPTGPVSNWSHPPFAAEIHAGKLYGRGAADMKSSIAAMVCACEQFMSSKGSDEGTGLTIAFLITSDEEGPAIDGTKRVVETLSERGQTIDYCLIGEPSSDKLLGDVAKIGRRGSLNMTLTVSGVQGHVAYPENALNPIHAAAPALAALSAEVWDTGNDYFPATSFQISNLNSGTGATNVIPGGLVASCNFRYSTEVSEEQLRDRTEAILNRFNLPFTIEWQSSGLPFLSKPGKLSEAVAASVQQHTGRDVAFLTTGGTSDGRFIAPTGAEVIELGPLNASIHQIDEYIDVDHLDTLKNIYLGVLQALST